MRHGLIVFKIDADGGKKWAKFVAMQHNSAALIYDLSTMKGTTKSNHKSRAQPYKIVQFQASKISPTS